MLFSARVEYVCMIAVIGLVTTNVEGAPFYGQFSKRNQSHHQNEIRQHSVVLMNLLKSRPTINPTLGLSTSEIVALGLPTLPSSDVQSEEAHRQHYEILHLYTNALNRITPTHTAIPNKLKSILAEINSLAGVSSWGTFTTPSTSINIDHDHGHSTNTKLAIRDYILRKVQEYIHTRLLG